MIAIIFTVFASIFFTLGIIINKSEKQKLVYFIIDMWIYAQENSTHSQIRAIISSIIFAIKNNLYRYMNLCFFIFAIIFLIVAIRDANTQLDPDAISNFFGGISNIAEIPFAYPGGKDGILFILEEKQGFCKYRTFDKSHFIAGVNMYLYNFNTSIDVKSNVISYTNYFNIAISTFISLISIYISIKITLFLLSIRTSYYYSLILIVIFDLIIAIILPVTTIYFVYILFGSIRLLTEFYLISIFSESTNFLVMYFSFIKVSFYPLWFTEALTLRLWFLRHFNESPAAAGEMMRQSFEIIFGLYKYSISNFFGDVFKIISGGWREIGYQNSFVNWSIVLSFIVSLSYILPVFFILVCNKSIIFRESFLRLLQWLAEHERGPVIGLAIALAAISAFAFQIGI
jgi:hypothetical protein